MDYSMKLKAIGILLLLLLPMLCSAQTDVLPSDTVATDTVETQQPPVTIGYLSYDSALVAMPGYAIVEAQMKELRQAYEAELKRVEDEFNKKYEDFLDEQRDFPRTILLKRQTELQEMLQRNVAFKQQGLRSLAKARTDALAPLREKLNAVIAQVAREKELKVVLNTDSNACPFIDQQISIDLQQTVTEQLNAEESEKTEEAEEK